MKNNMKNNAKYAIIIFGFLLVASFAAAGPLSIVDDDFVKPQSRTSINMNIETDVIHCYQANETYAVYHNGLWWAWLAPFATDTANIWPELPSVVPDASLMGDGWRNVADETEWALRPEASLFNYEKCAAQYFMPATGYPATLNECNYGDGDSGYITYQTWPIDPTHFWQYEFWVVHDDCGGSSVTCYVDEDMDGYGSDTTIIASDGSCDTSQGESTNSDDCNDENALVNPGEAEICNDIDDDCDALVDDGLDIDDDGVYGCNIDRCLDTESDPWTEETLGVNRYMWDAIWKTKNPKKAIVPATEFSMDYTYGCSCIQLLDEIQAETGDRLNGHYKHGCSKSIIQEWHDGTYYNE